MVSRNARVMQGPQLDTESQADKGELRDGAQLSDEDASDVEDEFDTGLTDNQNRLLFLITLYSSPAKTNDDIDQWVKRQALMVLLYEGIVGKVFEYDYAPSLEYVEFTRTYFNMSHEGSSDIDFLREEELVNALKLPSRMTRPTICYQASEKGLALVQKIPKEDKDIVYDLCCVPSSREILQVEWDGMEFWLQSNSGYRHRSTVTDTEDVSYVSSAYLPQCLRHGGRPTLSNAHRATECAIATSVIRNDLEEIITLNSVSIIVSEYIPSGANEIIFINRNVGSSDRVQGGLLTPKPDVVSDCDVGVDPGLTSISVLDYTPAGHICFEADIRYPNEESIVQVETFGVSMSSQGTCFYGMQVEALQDRIKDNMSLDHLSRLLVDVHQDSSNIVDSVLAEHQKAMLDLVFMSDVTNRDKVNLIIANEITPHLMAEEYMDKGEYENEMKQVLGEIHAAFDISEYDTLIFGSHGLLLAGPNSRHHEPLLTAYLRFMSVDIFLRNFYARMYFMDEDIRTTKSLMESQEEDPNAAELSEQYVYTLSQNIARLYEILKYINESVSEVDVPGEPPQQAGKSLYRRLQLVELKQQVQRRGQDLVRTVKRIVADVRALELKHQLLLEQRKSEQAHTITNALQRVHTLQESNHKATRTLETIQILIAGLLAFEVLDRLTGEWTVMDASWFQEFAESVIKDAPAAWFSISLLFWIIIAFTLVGVMKYRDWRNRGTTELRIKLHKKINLKNMQLFLADRIVISQETHASPSGRIVHTHYREKNARDWAGFAPTVKIEYDEQNEYVHYVTLRYNRHLANAALKFNDSELREKMVQQLTDASVFANNGSQYCLMQHKRDHRIQGRRNDDQEEVASVDEHLLELKTL